MNNLKIGTSMPGGGSMPRPMGPNPFMQGQNPGMQQAVQAYNQRQGFVPPTAQINQPVVPGLAEKLQQFFPFFGGAAGGNPLDTLKTSISDFFSPMGK